jgi:hypothetical protein
MSSFFHNKHYTICFIQNELEYLLGNDELSDEFKKHIERTMNLLEDAFNQVENIDKVMTFKMTEENFLQSHKKIRI